MADKIINKILLPISILAFWGRLYLTGTQSEEKNLFVIFSICIGILAFFTVLISVMLKQNKKSAPELMARTMTFWWMVLLFLIGVTTDKIVCMALIHLFSALAFWEYLTFQGTQALVKKSTLAFCLALIPINFLLQSADRTQDGINLIAVFLVLILPSLMVFENNTEKVLAKFGYAASGVLFFVFASGLAASLAAKSIMVLLLCFFLTEIRDMISYWLGKMMAKSYEKNPNSGFYALMNLKIAPNVSPNKSWGVGILTLVLIIGLALSFQQLLPKFGPQTVSLEFLILWGAVIGFFGLLGDLVFSMFKREFGLKDSGQLLPGKTGIIDRIDSLVLTIPATYFLFHYFYF